MILRRFSHIDLVVRGVCRSVAAAVAVASIVDSRWWLVSCFILRGHGASLVGGNVGRRRNDNEQSVMLLVDTFEGRRTLGWQVGGCHAEARWC